MAATREDLVQVGVTDHAHKQIKELLEDTDYFHTEQDIFRLAVAISIARGDKVTKKLKNSAIHNKWRVADDASSSSQEGVRLDDREGTLAKLVSTLAPESQEMPYRYSQYLATLGINYLHTQIFKNGKTLYEAISPPAETQDPK
jgi:hypothetical protein